MAKFTIDTDKIKEGLTGAVKSSRESCFGCRCES